MTTTRMELLESRAGRPIRDLLVDALEARRASRGMVPLVCADLGLSYGTLYNWCSRLGINISNYHYADSSGRP